MKALILLLVMSAVVCLCAISASADMLIDSFNYPSTAALQANWNNNGVLPTIATVGGVTCMDLYMDSTGSSYAATAANMKGSWNLTGLTGVRFSIAATDPSQVFYPFVSFTMGNGAYWSIPAWNALTNQLQVDFGPLSGRNGAGTLDWANVTLISVGYYANLNSGPGHVYFSNFTAVMPSGSLNVGVTLEDYSGDLSLLPIRLDCLDSTGSVAYTSTVTPIANPVTITFANLYVGSYTVRASAAKYLSATTTVSVSNNAAATASLSLRNGDLDGDGKVTSTDLNIGLQGIDQRGGQ